MAKILIADDEKMMRDLMVEMLEDSGHEVSLAYDGVQALDMIKSENFDILIIDIIMPFKGGYEVISELKFHNSHLKTIAISGGDNMGTGEKYLGPAGTLGADKVLCKPFLMKQMLEAITEVLAENNTQKNAE